MVQCEWGHCGQEQSRDLQQPGVHRADVIPGRGASQHGPRQILCTSSLHILSCHLFYSALVQRVLVLKKVMFESAGKVTQNHTSKGNAILFYNCSFTFYTSFTLSEQLYTLSESTIKSKSYVNHSTAFIFHVE